MVLAAMSVRSGFSLDAWRTRTIADITHAPQNGTSGAPDGNCHGRAMDRSVFVHCAAALLPLSAILVAGCDSPSANTTTSVTKAPAVLAELEHSMPGRRRIPQAPRLAAAVETSNVLESQEELETRSGLGSVDPDETFEAAEAPS